MFKNREFRIRVVKTDKAQTIPTEIPQSETIDFVQLSELTKDVLKTAAIFTAGVIVTKLVVNAACDIIVKHL